MKKIEIIKYVTEISLLLISVYLMWNANILSEKANILIFHSNNLMKKSNELMVKANELIEAGNETVKEVGLKQVSLMNRQQDFVEGVWDEEQLEKIRNTKKEAYENKCATYEKLFDSQTLESLQRRYLLYGGEYILFDAEFEKIEAREIIENPYKTFLDGKVYISFGSQKKSYDNNKEVWNKKVQLENNLLKEANKRNLRSKTITRENVFFRVVTPKEDHPVVKAFLIGEQKVVGEKSLKGLKERNGIENLYNFEHRHAVNQLYSMTIDMSDLEEVAMWLIQRCFARY